MMSHTWIAVGSDMDTVQTLNFRVQRVTLLFSRSVMSDSLWLRGLQHSRLPCSSPSPRACSNSCPYSWWCHPTNSSSVVPFSCCLQFFPGSRSFLMSWLCIRWPKHWCFRFSISISNEYSGLIERDITNYLFHPLILLMKRPRPKEGSW